MQQDLVSIVTPLFNSGRFIAKTIESIQAQNYQNWELLITDDSSSDDSFDIANSYAQNDNRIRVFRLDTNSGAGAARNNSISKAKGRYIAFCDSDDRWLPNKLSTQLNILNETGASIIYSSYLTCDETDKITGIVVAFKKTTYKDILKDDRMGFLTCLYDTQKLGKVYMPLIRKRQDWGLKILLLKKAKYAKGLVEPLAIYRIRKNSLSHNKYGLIKYNIGIYRDILKYNTLRAYCKFIFDFMPHYLYKKFRLKIINQ